MIYLLQWAPFLNEQYHSNNMEINPKDSSPNSHAIALSHLSRSPVCLPPTPVLTHAHNDGRLSGCSVVCIIYQHSFPFSHHFIWWQSEVADDHTAPHTSPERVLYTCMTTPVNAKLLDEVQQMFWRLMQLCAHKVDFKQFLLESQRLCDMLLFKWNMMTSTSCGQVYSSMMKWWALTLHHSTETHQIMSYLFQVFSLLSCTLVVTTKWPVSWKESVLILDILGAASNLCG